MVTTAHLLTGATIGYLTGNVYLGAALAFSAHYILDAVPHACWKPVKGYKKYGWHGMDKKDFLVKAIEPALGAILTILFIAAVPHHLRWPVAAGAFFGWLPDSLVFLEWALGIKRIPVIRNFEIKYHRHLNSLRGLLPQVVLVGAELVYMFRIAT